MVSLDCAHAQIISRIQMTSGSDQPSTPRPKNTSSQAMHAFLKIFVDFQITYKRKDLEGKVFKLVMPCSVESKSKNVNVCLLFKVAGFVKCK